MSNLSILIMTSAASDKFQACLKNRSLKVLPRPHHCVPIWPVPRDAILYDFIDPRAFDGSCVHICIYVCESSALFRGPERRFQRSWYRWYASRGGSDHVAWMITRCKDERPVVNYHLSCQPSGLQDSSINVRYIRCKSLGSV